MSKGFFRLTFVKHCGTHEVREMFFESPEAAKAWAWEQTTLGYYAALFSIKDVTNEE